MGPVPHWLDGYVTDIDYTSGFMREMTPAWLAFVSLMLGQRPPDLSGPLAIADLGCGHGITDAVVAATMPQADVWAFDFNPTHIDSGRHLAAEAGLDNLHFEERSFAEMAAAPEGRYPAFDIVTLHGVWSWVSLETARQTVDFLQRFLRPGGLVYVGYNALAGWASMVPVQRLMHQLTRHTESRADLAARTAVEYVERLGEAHGAFFAQNPVPLARLQPTHGLDARYVAHEYLHAQWRPTDMAEVSAELERAKCGYLGSATVVDNMPELSVPPAMLASFGTLADPVLREQVSDLASARAFRRDVYRRGSAVITQAEAERRLETLTIAACDTLPPGDLRFECALGHINGRHEIYDPLIERLAEGPLSMAEARRLPCLLQAPLAEAMQTFALLVSSGRALPVLDRHAHGVAARRLNAAFARRNGLGAEIHVLAAPVLGGGVNTDAMESLLVGDLLAGVPADAELLAERLYTALTGTGRAVRRAGTPVSDPAEARALVRESVDGLLAQRVPLLRRLGVLAA